MSEELVNIERRGYKMTINKSMTEFMRRRGWTVIKGKTETAPEKTESKPSKKKEEQKPAEEKKVESELL